MIISLVTSIYFGRLIIKRSNKFGLSFLMAFILNVVILGLGSIWWFLTERDGISQGLGVLYYCIAMGVISVINFIVLSFSKSG